MKRRKITGMRRVKFSPWFVFLVLSCKTVDVVVESDYSYRGNFKRYSSFDFLENVDPKTNVNQVQLFEEGIAETLQTWGYKRKQTKPDLLVMFKYYEDELEILGFKQPAFEHWIQTNYSRMVFQDSINLSSSRVAVSDEVYERGPVLLKEGAVQITFYDRRRKIMVWQGYASGFFEKDAKSLKHSHKAILNRILYEYKLLAYDGLKR